LFENIFGSEPKPNLFLSVSSVAKPAVALFEGSDIFDKRNPGLATLTLGYMLSPSSRDL